MDESGNTSLTDNPVSVGGRSLWDEAGNLTASETFPPVLEGGKRSSGTHADLLHR